MPPDPVSGSDTGSDSDSSAPENPGDHVLWACRRAKSLPALPATFAPLLLLLQWLTSPSRASAGAQIEAASREILQCCFSSRDENAEVLEGCHPAVRKVLQLAGPNGGLHVVALKALLARHSWPDVAIARDLTNGLPLVGTLPTTNLPRWSLLPPAPEPSIEGLIQASGPLRLAVLHKARCARPPEGEIAIKIWEQTVAEVQAGLLSPLRPALQESRNLRPLTRRFGLQQISSKGRKKVRTIDDFTASGVNGATRAVERLRHHHVDDLSRLSITW